MIKKYGDIIASIFIIAVAVLVFVLSFSIEQFEVSGVGAQFLPQVVSILFLLLGVILLKDGLKKSKTITITDKDKNSLADINAVMYTLVLLIVYVALLNSVGYLIMTTVYLFLQFIIVSSKDKINLVLFGILSVVVSLSTYYLFLLAFNVILPSGILG